MVLVGENILLKKEFRCCFVSRCIQTKSGFNVFAPLLSHSVDAGWVFYDLLQRDESPNLVSYAQSPASCAPL